MGDLVQFPRPPLEHGPTAVEADGSTYEIVACHGIVHVYANPYGRCQCGEKLWGWDGDGDAPRLTL